MRSITSFGKANIIAEGNIIPLSASKGQKEDISRTAAR
jgi:hypothetical protein